MNNIEETLWNYIDGNCTAEEQKAIGQLIAQDEAYRLKYLELLKMNEEFSSIELDEPSMAFTYNVMETIRAEQAQQPLKAAINKRIILGIAIFFAFAIMAIMGYILATTTWTSGKVSVQLPDSLKLPDVKGFITKPMVQGFFFFDMVLALFLFDAFLRRKKISKME